MDIDWSPGIEKGVEQKKAEIKDKLYSDYELLIISILYPNQMTTAMSDRVKKIKSGMGEKRHPYISFSDWVKMQKESGGE